MKLFGFEIRRVKSQSGYETVGGHRGWYPIVREPFPGAWQQNREYRLESVLQHPTVFACITLIASDIAKMRYKLVQETSVGSGIWLEVESPSYSPVLRRPNDYQNHTQFRKWWMVSKLVHGNTYALKERDQRGGIGSGNVRRLHILDPCRVRPLVAPDGAVFYQLGDDNLAGIESVTAPASEIIHDRTPLFHPLMGVPPLFAAGGPAATGLTVQNNSLSFFANGSNPSGVLTAPGEISQSTADRITEHWEREYGGANSGKIAVLGDDLKFMQMRMTSVDAQTEEMLRWTAESVCAAFRVPAFMVGASPVPANQNTELLTRTYYSTCLHEHVSDMEAALDEGLGLETTKEGRRLGIELDKDALLQMDTATQYKTLSEGVRGGFLAPNEARAKVDLRPLPGGDTVYLQRQDIPLQIAAEAKVESVPVVSGDPPEDTDAAETRAVLTALTVEVARLSERAVMPMLPSPKHVEPEPEVTADEFNHFWQERAAA